MVTHAAGRVNEMLAVFLQHIFHLCIPSAQRRGAYVQPGFRSHVQHIALLQQAGERHGYLQPNGPLLLANLHSLGQREKLGDAAFFRKRVTQTQRRVWPSHEQAALLSSRVGTAA